jgi:uncharacterized membrane protein YecN with MAPEG domain
VISSLYACALAILFVALTARTILLRRSLKIAIGDGGNQKLQRAIRVQGNFCETVPIALILLILAEVNYANYLVIHLCGIALFFGRLIHAIGVSSVKEKITIRVLGMVLTLTSILLLALTNLIQLIKI